MKRKRFSVEQIVAAVKQHDLGVSAADIARKLRIAEQTFYRWKKQYSGLEALGAEVWEPFARNNQIDRASHGWAYRIGQADLRDVRDADGLFAVVNGCPPDEGVMVELGMAIAWEKPVFLFRDDFRRCTDSAAYPLNLMVFTGLPETGWEAYWYGSIEEIANPDKALAQWLKDDTLP